MLKRLAPEPAKKYSKKRVLYNKIDFELGKKFYGSSVGFMNNFKNGKDVLTKSNEKIKNTNPELYYLIKNQLDTKWDPLLEKWYVSGSSLSFGFIS